MSELRKLEPLIAPPKGHHYPCEFGMRNAVENAVSQMGTVAAYNLLCAYAERLAKDIEAGDVKYPRLHYATKPAQRFFNMPRLR